MVRVAAPVVMASIKVGLDAKSRGGTWKEAGKASGRALVQNLKRQAASMLKSGGGPVKKKKRKPKSRDIFGEQ